MSRLLFVVILISSFFSYSRTPLKSAFVYECAPIFYFVLPFRCSSLLTSIRFVDTLISNEIQFVPRLHLSYAGVDAHKRLFS
jgi:hypothetical protein